MIDPDDLDDPRPDHERAENAHLGLAVSSAAREMLDDGEDPRALVTAFMSTALAVSLQYFGQPRTEELFRGTADSVARLPMGAGCAGQA